jgi:hypothetical protein
MPEPVEHLTLREKLIEAENAARSLIDHLEHALIPKAHQLRRICRQGHEQEEEVTDMTVRDYARQLIASDDYTRQLAEKTEGLLTALESELRKLLYG